MQIKQGSQSAVFAGSEFAAAHSFVSGMERKANVTQHGFAWEVIDTWSKRKIGLI